LEDFGCLGKGNGIFPGGNFREIQHMETWEFDGGGCWLRSVKLQKLDSAFDLLHPGRLTWNLPTPHLERKLIFETSMIVFHVNLQVPVKLKNLLEFFSTPRCDTTAVPFSKEGTRRHFCKRCETEREQTSNISSFFKGGKI